MKSAKHSAQYDKKIVELLFAIDECNRNVKHLNHAVQKLERLIPFTATTYEGMTEDDTGHLDQFIYRFIKLQECLGNRLFKSVLDNIGEYKESEPFIDVLNKIEKFDIVRFEYVLAPKESHKKEHEWHYMRGVRNNLAHGYPESAEERLFATNETLKYTFRLFGIYDSAKRYISNKVLFNIQGLDLEPYKTPDVPVLETLRQKYW